MKGSLREHQAMQQQNRQSVGQTLAQENGVQAS